MPIPLKDGLLYGPVDSRRYGRSLGVNPLPLDRKLCSMDCGYCQYGDTRNQAFDSTTNAPSAAQLSTAFDHAFRSLASENDVPDRITVAGNGEPTLHPEFLELSRALAAARDEHFLGATIGLLSNSMHLDREPVVTAINELYDAPAMKLEWGSAECFAALTRVASAGLERVLTGLERLERFTVQSMFVRGPDVDNASATEVDAWIGHLERVQPLRVELYSLDRPAADERLRPVPRDELTAIAERVRGLGIEVDAY